MTLRNLFGVVLAGVMLTGVCLGIDAEAEKRANNAKRQKQKAANLAQKIKTIKPLDVAGSMKLDVPYKSTPQGDVVMDIYLPVKKTKNVPIVLYTHGGGWGAGSHKGVGNASFRVIFTALSKAGFCVVSVNYRLCRRNDNSVKMRDCVIDSKDALRFMSRHKDEFGVDPNRCFVMGDSAGGQIAQVVLLSPPENMPGDEGLAKYSYKMVAGVSWYGPCDFENTELFTDRFGKRIVGTDTPPEDKLKMYREMSSINYVTSDSPPLLMMNGEFDGSIPVDHVYLMQEKVKQVQAKGFAFLVVKNATHNWRATDESKPIVPSRDVITERTIEFLRSRK